MIFFEKKVRKVLSLSLYLLKGVLRFNKPRLRLYPLNLRQVMLSKDSFGLLKLISNTILQPARNFCNSFG